MLRLLQQREQQIMNHSFIRKVLVQIQEGVKKIVKDRKQYYIFPDIVSHKGEKDDTIFMQSIFSIKNYCIDHLSQNILGNLLNILLPNLIKPKETYLTEYQNDGKVKDRKQLSPNQIKPKGIYLTEYQNDVKTKDRN